MSTPIRVEPTWRILLRDLGVSEQRLLRRAEVPLDLFSRDQARVSTDEYFRLWNALATEVDAPDFPLTMGQAFSTEMFSPPMFAGLCSPDLNTAAERLSLYKRLLGPFRLGVERESHATTLTFGCLDAAPPPSVGTTEMVFLVHFVRMATRAPVRPIAVTLPYALDRPEPYRAFFGVEARQGPEYTVAFSEVDGRRPFLTGNERMWEFFEPELRRRLVELEERAGTTERVEAALTELLPSGRSSIGDVSRELGMSPRTLQRRLGGEQQRYQDILTRTRERLAHHYLTSSSMSGAEISFLLGYDDPNSFFRAFNQWTGSTPETVRSQG